MARLRLDLIGSQNVRMAVEGMLGGGPTEVCGLAHLYDPNAEYGSCPDLPDDDFGDLKMRGHKPED